VDGCFYHDIFRAEGVPELTACFCCSLDKVWFEGFDRYGVRFRQDSCLRHGDADCCLTVSRISRS